MRKFKVRNIVYCVLLLSVVIEIWSFYESSNKNGYVEWKYFFYSIYGFIISIVLFIATLIINYILDKNKANKKYRK